MNVEQPAPQRIALTGLYNLRDVGGYRTVNGRSIRRQTLYRADSPHNLPISSQQALLEMGLQAVIDLRSPHERQQAPNPLAAAAQIAYHAIPLYSRWHDIAPGGDWINLPEHYALLLDRCQQPIAQICRIMLPAAAFPLLIHCQVGKDRTGLVIALLLSLAGVPAATITADYSISAHFLQPVLAKMHQEWAAAGRDMSFFGQFLTAPPAAMQHMLTHLQQQYGGAAGYLQAIGLAHEEIAQLTARLLSDGEALA